MQFRRVNSNKTLALTRVNTLLGRVFSAAATLVGVQTVTNALNQFQEHALDPFWFWISFGGIVGSHLAIIFMVWVIGDGKYGFAALTVSTVFGLATWSFQIGDGQLHPGEQPWLWWAVGVAGISSVGGFGVIIAGIFLLLLPTIWFFIQISEIGLPVEPWLAFQDASFSFLFSSVLATLVVVLRYESAKVDEANQKANQAAVDLARENAAQHERDRVDALVHDSVLTTLIVAANASDAFAESDAKKLAESAIQKLTVAQLAPVVSEEISVNSFFSALAIAVNRQAPNVEVDSEGANDISVPAEVAEALTESTLQALANATQHAGENALVQVYLRGTKRGIKIVVKDNGKGFRPSRVQKNRLGLKLSIFGRMQAVGGKVFIDSKIGIGTNVIIEWSAE